MLVIKTNWTMRCKIFIGNHPLASHRSQPGLGRPGHCGRRYNLFINMINVQIHIGESLYPSDIVCRVIDIKMINVDTCPEDAFFELDLFLCSAPCSTWSRLSTNMKIDGHFYVLRYEAFRSRYSNSYSVALWRYFVLLSDAGKHSNNILDIKGKTYHCNYARDEGCDRCENHVTVHTPTRQPTRRLTRHVRRDNRRDDRCDAWRKCNSFENDRIVYRARVPYVVALVCFGNDQITLCSLVLHFQYDVMRDTLSNMVSCFLMSRQQAHIATSNSQFSHI